MTIRVLVADGQALVRGSFRVLVDTAPGLAPAGEAAAGAAKTHVGRLLMEPGARDRAQLAIAACNTGLVYPP